MNLLIVESPAKAKTIEKYLGVGWRVVASVGHVRDLVPENGSVDPDDGFKMKWQIMPDKEKQIKLILDAVKKSDKVYLASDPDREGESISWHILEILNSKGALADKQVFRVVFHEITKKAVQAAIEAPREIDQSLVDAYLVRRALDYLIGFKLSPVLWRKNMGRSAGRVQSVAVALVVGREREIEQFKPQEYWSLDAEMSKNKDAFKARLSMFGAEKIDKMTIANETRANEILFEIKDIKTAKVLSVEKKRVSRRPAAPFTTSTLQQEAARKLRFSAKRTSAAAQKLYESGLITYIRTDSTNLSADATMAMREYIKSVYGDAFMPKSPNIYQTKSKNAQEAHEAIRPTSFGSDRPDIADSDQAKLYDLIWKRSIACQMSNAEFDNVAADIEAGRAIFRANGSTRVFDGFIKVYIEDKDDNDDGKSATDDDGESKLPPLESGDIVDIIKFLTDQHFTLAPPRYTEASLIKKLEDLGIGRPSTYASIMSVIVDRGYVALDKQRFFATPSGWLITAFLTKYFTDIVDVNFTAKTEDALDDVSNGKIKKIAALDSFWGAFNPLVSSASAVPAAAVMESVNNDLHDHLFPGGDDLCPECRGGKLSLKVSKYGAFLACSNYPNCKYTKNLGGANEGPAEATDEKSPLDLGEGISFKIGKFGPYVTDGAKNASAKKYTRETITLDAAQELLSGGIQKAEPEELGADPQSGGMVYYYPSGKYGAYVKLGKDNAGVKSKPDLETALELIAARKAAPKKTFKKFKK